MDLLERHLDVKTMPSQHGSPFTVVVTIALTDLLDGLGTATLETGERLSAGEVRRLACRAGIIPMVLDGDSMPIDVGRKRRCFDFTQKLSSTNATMSNEAAPPSTATGHRRTASTTTTSPGPRAGRPTPSTASRCAPRTTTWPTTPRPGT
jgi:hypothetical protein